MHFSTRRVGQDLGRWGGARLAVLLLAVLTALCAPVQAQEDDRTEDVKAAVEAYLRTYQEAAMLYTGGDLRTGTVAEAGVYLQEGAAPLLVGGEERTLEELRENIAFVEKKAAFYAGMRQAQGIYREELRLSYDWEKLKLEGESASAVVTETAVFRYTDSARMSIYETTYWAEMVRVEGRWLIAGITDKSQFDEDHKGDAAFDPTAALAAFEAALAAPDCRITVPAGAAEGGIPYNGANAAAYAYTYARQDSGRDQAAFYNPLFTSYAGRGGDCMNFASQCVWAGFGGSETDAAVSGHGLPMDAAGANTWFGRSAAVAGSEDSHSWISCQNFRRYLTGSKDGAGSGGSNTGSDAGLCATVLDAAPGSALSAVQAEELVGAVAHVEGVGGLYGHAIVLTAATGTDRSSIWFCSHTKDMTHIKLGDCCIGPIKVYIPRCLRTGGARASALEVERLSPVGERTTGTLSIRTAAPQYKLVIIATAPDGSAAASKLLYGADACAVDCLFRMPGLYRVECVAQAVQGGAVDRQVFFVRCAGPEAGVPAVETAENDGWEMPAWLRPSGGQD